MIKCTLYAACGLCHVALQKDAGLYMWIWMTVKGVAGSLKILYSPGTTVSKVP